MMFMSASGSSSLLEHLQALAAQSPELKDAARLYEVILPFLESADLHAEPVPMSRDEACKKLADGIPLLIDVDLHLDFTEARTLMISLNHAMIRVSGNRRYTCEKVRQALEEDAIDVRLLMGGIAAGDRTAVKSFSLAHGIDAEFIWTLGQYVLRPALHSWRQQLHHLTKEAPWGRGYCPLCGSMPVLGELRGNHMSRHLRCVQCGTDWPFHRIQCPYCGNEDHLTLGFLFEEARRNEMRVEVCELCRGYLKVIVSFEATLPWLLSVKDLATLHLDCIAEERGYRKAPEKY